MNLRGETLSNRRTRWALIRGELTQPEIQRPSGPSKRAEKQLTNRMRAYRSIVDSKQRHSNKRALLSQRQDSIAQRLSSELLGGVVLVEVDMEVPFFNLTVDHSLQVSLWPSERMRSTKHDGYRAGQVVQQDSKLGSQMGQSGWSVVR